MADHGRIMKELREIANDKASGVTAEIVGDDLQHLVGTVPGPRDTPYDGGFFRVDIQLGSQYPFAPPKMRFLTRVWHPNVSSANGAICLGVACSGLLLWWQQQQHTVRGATEQPLPPLATHRHSPTAFILITYCDARTPAMSTASRLSVCRSSLVCVRAHPHPTPPKHTHAHDAADILKDQWSPALTLKTALLSLQALLASPQPDDPQDAVVAEQYRSDKRQYEATARYWTEAFASAAGAASTEDKVRRIEEMGFSSDAALAALQAAAGDENAALEALLGG